MSHPENIEEVKVDGILYYKVRCNIKDNKTNKMMPTMKGLISCDVWPTFIKQLTDKILNTQ